MDQLDAVGGMNSAADYAALRAAAARMRDDDIQLGNEGIDIGTWEPTHREPERPTLPGEEHTEALKGRTWREA